MSKKDKTKGEKTPKQSKRHPPPRPGRRAWAIVGLVAMLPVGWLLVLGQLDLAAAGLRALVILGVVLAGQLLIGPLLSPVLLNRPAASSAGVPAPGVDVGSAGHDTPPT